MRRPPPKGFILGKIGVVFMWGMALVASILERVYWLSAILLILVAFLAHRYFLRKNDDHEQGQ